MAQPLVQLIGLPVLLQAAVLLCCTLTLVSPHLVFEDPFSGQGFAPHIVHSTEHGQWMCCWLRSYLGFHLPC